MAAFELPLHFQRSYNDRMNYPCNLLGLGARMYPWKLEDYERRLKIKQSSLCVSSEKDVEVPVRDVFDRSDDDTAARMIRVHSANKLVQAIGVETEFLDSIPKQVRLKVTGIVPVCRFIYLYAMHSRDHLRVTYEMLVQILTFYQVMPVYVDFILAFGSALEQYDMKFGNFCSQLTLQDQDSNYSIPSLRRSGRHFQLCYVLKGVTLKKEDHQNSMRDEWSVRQAAVHHQFDVNFGTTLWIVTKGRTDLEQKFKKLTGSDGDPCSKSFGDVSEALRSNIAAHLMFCDWAMEDWRWYLCWIEEMLDEKSTKTLHGTWRIDTNYRQEKRGYVQDLQHSKDIIELAISSIKSNIDVMIALKDFYVALLSNGDIPVSMRHQCGTAIKKFASDLDELVRTLKLLAVRAESLSTLVNDRHKIVVLKLQEVAVERTELLNSKMEKEAIRMRIITVVTLVYLPATFVSTFFSTDVVRYQDGSGPAQENFSIEAMLRWLEVVLPLTMITLAISWWASRGPDTKPKLHDGLLAGIKEAMPTNGRSWLSFMPWQRKGSLIPKYNSSKI